MMKFLSYIFLNQFFYNPEIERTAWRNNIIRRRLFKEA